MKQTELIMGMPITVEVIEPITKRQLASVFEYFRTVDARYSTYRDDSEVSQINRGLPRSRWSSEMKSVLKLCEQTKQQTRGYFDVMRGGKLDPSGLVKGWAINNAAKLLNKQGFRDFYIEAGGDIQASGHSAEHKAWRVGIRNPFDLQQIIKVVQVSDKGVATSGTYVRGEHVYNPHADYQEASFVKSLTVIGPDIYEADRFATAAFAMGADGVAFIEELPDFEAYMVDERQIATYTSGFEDYVAENV